MASISPFGTDAPGGGINSPTPSGTDTVAPNTWVAYKTSGGEFGLARQGSTPPTITQLVQVGQASTLGQLVSNSSTEIQKAFKSLGIPTKLWGELITQLDAGAVLSGSAKFVQVGANGPSSNVDTNVGSEAVSSPIIPTPSIGGISSSSILGVLGSVDFWKGIGLVLAGAVILVFAGLEIKKIA